MERLNFATFGQGPGRPNGLSVAIVGAGPAGLAASGYLSCLGYAVEVFDKMPRPGGLMSFGIPEQRLPGQRIEEAAELLSERYGVKFRLATKICGDEALCLETGDSQARNLKSLSGRMVDHDAVMLCTGAWRGSRLDVPGAELPGVCTGLNFLMARRLRQFCQDEFTDMDARNKKLAVIGAGHSAVDAAATALREGADKVSMIYRRGISQAPCGRAAIDELADAGADVLEHTGIRRILGTDRVEALELTGADGLSQRLLEADMVVAAIGDRPSVPFERELGLAELRSNPGASQGAGGIMTALEGVFVAGDALTGPTKIGRAIYNALCVARIVDRWLSSRSVAGVKRRPGGLS